MKYVLKSAYDRNGDYVTSFNKQLRSPISRYSAFREDSFLYKGIQIQPNTGCGRNNSHILKVNKNQKKQGTQKKIFIYKKHIGCNFFKHS